MPSTSAKVHNGSQSSHHHVNDHGNGNGNDNSNDSSNGHAAAPLPSASAHVSGNPDAIVPYYASQSDIRDYQRSIDEARPNLIPSHEYTSRRRRNASNGHATSRTLRRKKSDTILFLQPALIIAVALWYTLGVLSIATSKLLLTACDDNVHECIGGISPTTLTIQQLLLGSTLLGTIVQRRGGVLPWTGLGVTPEIRHVSDHKPERPRSNASAIFRPLLVWLTGDRKADVRHARLVQLFGAAICFAVGFWTTNMAFSGTSASFVETIKAAEPITSAALAVSWGIEQLSSPEVSSLASIVVGVILSTVGNTKTATTTTSSSGISTSIHACVIVMTANLCFSFRGLFQKLWRAGAVTKVDDWNLQYRMQQIGVCCILPFFVVMELLPIAGHMRNMWIYLDTTTAFQTMARYAGLAIVNGAAFTSYNLASTYLLSRITVVHHAALNCLRRIFAIVITSIIFHVTLTWVGILGIAVSVGGFLSFSYHKAERNKQKSFRKVSSLLRDSSEELGTSNAVDATSSSSNARRRNSVTGHRFSELRSRGSPPKRDNVDSIV